VTRRLASRLVATVVLSLLGCPTPVVGSDCISMSQRDSFSKSVLVFEGRARRVVPVVEGQVDLVIFDVDQVWKGPVEKAVTLAASRRPAMGNGYTFQEGQQYVVYAIDTVNQDWAELKPLASGAFVYGLNGCTPRVRTDVTEEARLLGRRSRRP
jgi:hypothetical protein